MQTELFKKIKTEAEHELAMSRLNYLMSVVLNEEEQRELYILSLVIADYEGKRYPASKEAELEFALGAYLQECFPNAPEKVDVLTREYMEQLNLRGKQNGCPC